MTKRILCAILTFILITSSVSVFALEDYRELNALGVMPEEIYAKKEGELVTREELAYITARIMDKSDRAPIDTRFCDVDASNEFSGYIELLALTGIVNGTGGCAFVPEGNVTVDVANKMLLSAIGYGALCEEIGGYPEGYRTIARALGLNKGVSAVDGGYLSVDAIAVMVSNLMETPLPGMGIQTGNISSELTDKGTSVLGNILGISVYEGYVTEVDMENGKVSFVAEQNFYDTNPVKVKDGEKLTLTAKDKILAKSFESVPALAYVNDYKELVYIEVRDNVWAGYAVIEAVNGSEKTDAKYSVTNMNTIGFVDGDDDYFDVSSSAALRYNGELTTGAKSLIGKTARIVIVEDEVTSIETWDLEHGGIITNINAGEITFKNAKKKVNKLTDINTIDNITAIINGQIGKYSDIKKDSLFEYYVYDNDLVLVVSELKIVNTLDGITDSGVIIGDTEYNTKDVYYSVNGEDYYRNSGYDPLFGTTVYAYIGPAGYVEYVSAYSNDDLRQRKFYGIIGGVDTGTGLSNKTQVKVWVLENEYPEEIFEITKNTVFDDGLSISDLENNIENLDGNGLYMFEVTNSGVIERISLPKRLRGFETDLTVNNTLDGIPQVNFGGRYLYFPDTPIVSVYKKDGEFTVRNTQWQDFSAQTHTGYNVKAKFYSEDGGLDVSLLLLTGDLEEIRGKSSGYVPGVVISKKNTLDEDGNEKSIVSVLSKDGVKDILVSDKHAEELDKYAYIAYYKNIRFNEDGIRLSSVSSLNGRPETWTVSNTANGVHLGYVEGIGNNTIAFDNGNVCSFKYNECTFIEYDENDMKEPFKLITKEELSEGDYVYYDQQTTGIYCVIVIR